MLRTHARNLAVFVSVRYNTVFVSMMMKEWVGPLFLCFVPINNDLDQRIDVGLVEALCLLFHTYNYSHL